MRYVTVGGESVNSTLCGFDLFRLTPHKGISSEKGTASFWVVGSEGLESLRSYDQIGIHWFVIAEQRLKLFVEYFSSPLPTMPFSYNFNVWGEG